MHHIKRKQPTTTQLKTTHQQKIQEQILNRVKEIRPINTQHRHWDKTILC